MAREPPNGPKVHKPTGQYATNQPTQGKLKRPLSQTRRKTPITDYRGKKSNNKKEKPAAREGHTPPTTGNAGPRTNPTPLTTAPQPSSRGIHKPSRQTCPDLRTTNSDQLSTLGSKTASTHPSDGTSTVSENKANSPASNGGRQPNEMWDHQPQISKTSISLRASLSSFSL
ncbi:hypothetical protein TIFTF001_030405 [Ficus carica]|uniref:Uncharacterized protein n=1 Tax=Ficus carica TaxID=3494 RepID=A0AA88DTE7_FICCA|nr:hypothetical protein TIFTF001_030405 [Ficus carica]